MGEDLTCGAYDAVAEPLHELELAFQRLGIPKRVPVGGGVAVELVIPDQEVRQNTLDAPLGESAENRAAAHEIDADVDDALARHLRFGAIAGARPAVLDEALETDPQFGDCAFAAEVSLGDLHVPSRTEYALERL